MKTVGDVKFYRESISLNTLCEMSFKEAKKVRICQRPDNDLVVCCLQTDNQLICPLRIGMAIANLSLFTSREREREGLIIKSKGGNVSVLGEGDL